MKIPLTINETPTNNKMEFYLVSKNTVFYVVFLFLKSIVLPTFCLVPVHMFNPLEEYKSSLKYSRYNSGSMQIQHGSSEYGSLRD